MINHPTAQKSSRQDHHPLCILMQTHQQQTLPDYLAPDLRIISVGLNPSLPSVRDGYYFSGKRNRFWPALNASRLLQAPVTPSIDAMHTLLERDRIGFTDTVKRATAGAGDLRATDYRQWAPVLHDKLMALQTDIVWFHGKVAYKNFLKHTDHSISTDVQWGLQKNSIGKSRIFVAPNPSPANAVFSLDDLIAWFNQLADTIAQRKNAHRSCPVSTPHNL